MQFVVHLLICFCCHRPQLTCTTWFYIYFACLWQNFGDRMQLFSNISFQGDQYGSCKQLIHQGTRVIFLIFNSHNKEKNLYPINDSTPMNEHACLQSPVGISKSSPQTRSLLPKLAAGSGLYFHNIPQTESPCFAFSLCDSAGLSKIGSAYNSQLRCHYTIINIFGHLMAVLNCASQHLCYVQVLLRTIHISCTSPSRAFASHLKPPFLYL